MFKLQNRTKADQMIQKIQDFFELFAFGVCRWWGKKLGINVRSIRKAFIYFSFITFGSPIIIYLIMGFILENKEYFKPYRSRPSVWDLE